MSLPRPLLWMTTCLAFTVIVLGAYVRLSDAGLGCPDWPGCYGRATPWHAAEQIGAALASDPQGPVSHAKAWKEMLHRYLAGTLGLAILAIAVLAWRRPPPEGRRLPGALLLLVVFQALLGMWTVTLQLRPAVVAAHLLGGMATLALLVWLAARTGRPAGSGVVASPAQALLMPTRLLLALLVLQIGLGGWVSANYAALACADLPTCRGVWWPAMDFAAAFGATHAVGDLSPEALTAIHMSHRVGAVLVVAAAAWLGWRLLGERAMKPWGRLLLALSGLQALAGVGNVLLSLPLPLAVAHNAGAALLLATLVWIRVRVIPPFSGVRP